MNETVIDIYNALKQHDNRLSKRQFSRDYLGKCETYLFSNNYYGRQVSKDAAVALYNNLAGIAHHWQVMYEETQRERFRQNGELFKTLSQKALTVVFSE
jgi:hypothetical protein